MLGKKRTYANASFVKSMAQKYAKKKKSNNALVRGLRQNSLSNKSQWVKTTLCFSETIGLNTGAAGAAGVYVLSANGLFDPDITGGGHQPCGFDQYMALFSEFYVGKATIKAHVCAPAQTAVPVLAGISTLNTSTTSNDTRVYIENGATVTNVAGGSHSNIYTTLNQSVLIPQFVGKSTFSEADFAGDDTANPAEQVYFHIWVANFSGGNDAQQTLINMQVEYEVYFRRPKNVAIS